MKAIGKTVKEILTNLPADRTEPFKKLHDVILTNLPPGFEAAISYGGLGYVVPHKLYPSGYHCKSTEPLPFAGIASQKNSINSYYMGIYADLDAIEKKIISFYFFVRIPYYICLDNNFLTNSIH